MSQTAFERRDFPVPMRWPTPAAICLGLVNAVDAPCAL
jgi:hypothetical protein